MLDTYTNTIQTLTTDQEILFNINKINNCKAITHAAGSASVELNKPGYYLVSFHGTATATAAATLPIVIQLYNNAQAEPAAYAEELSAAANTPVDLSFTTIVRVRPSCCVFNNDTTLTIRNEGIAASLTNAELVITKIA